MSVIWLSPSAAFFQENMPGDGGPWERHEAELLGDDDVQLVGFGGPCVLVVNGKEHGPCGSFEQACDCSREP